MRDNVHSWLMKSTLPLCLIWPGRSLYRPRKTHPCLRHHRSLPGIIFSQTNVVRAAVLNTILLSKPPEVMASPDMPKPYAPSRKIQVTPLFYIQEPTPYLIRHSPLVNSLRMQREALAFRQQSTPESPWTAECFDTLGRIKRHLQDPFEAVNQHMKALKIWATNPELYLGPRAACYHALAQATYRCGDFHTARNQMAQAVLLTKERLGADHVDTWISRFELARYDIDCGDLTNGFTAMEQARTDDQETWTRPSGCLEYESLL